MLRRDIIADLTAPTSARSPAPHLMDPTLLGVLALAPWLLVPDIFGVAARRRLAAFGGASKAGGHCL